MQLVSLELSLREVKAVKSAKIIHKALSHSGSSSRVITKNEYIVVVVSAGSYIVNKIGRSGTPVRNCHLFDLKVVGLLNPIKILILSFFVFVLSFFSFAGRPPVTDNDLHAAQVIHIAASILQNSVLGYFLSRLFYGSAGLLGLALSGRGFLALAGRFSFAATTCESNSHNCSKGSCHQFSKHLSFHFSSSLKYIN